MVICRASGVVTNKKDRSSVKDTSPIATDRKFYEEMSRKAINSIIGIDPMFRPQKINRDPNGV